MGTLIDYWYYTGDTRWNHVAQEGLLFQVGPNNDYMPPNQTMTEGNDDQGFWGMAALSAAEYNFPNPPSDKPQWLALGQAVFNTQAARWEEQDCGGGLRWQIFTWNNGYNYKNSISQACFFNIAARLARYTGNHSYAEWAERTWDWMVAAKLLDLESYYIYDGMHVENCSHIIPYQWTYNAGAFLLGAAAMYNYSTGSAQEETWRNRVDGLLNGSLIFFAGNNNDIMTEVACEPVDRCNLDQQSFKAYLSRWIAAAVKLAPWIYGRVKPLLAASAAAAASTCAGGANGRMCGLKWTDHGRWDGSTGVGQQMAALEVVLANMIQDVRSPVANGSGGTSLGNAAAGGADDGFAGRSYPPVSPAGRAGACILTVLTVIGLFAGCVFVLVDENDHSSLPTRLAKACSAVRTAAGSNVFSRLHRRIHKQRKGKEVERLSGDGPIRNVPAPENSRAASTSTLVRRGWTGDRPEGRVPSSVPGMPGPKDQGQTILTGAVGTWRPEIGDDRGRLPAAHLPGSCQLESVLREGSPQKGRNKRHEPVHLSATHR